MHKFQVNLLKSWKLGSWSLKELDFWCVCVCVCAREGFFLPLKFETGSKCEREGERERFGLESERGLGVVGCIEEGDFGLLLWRGGGAVVIARGSLPRMRHRQ